MSRFVRPDTDTLELSDGDWLLVKRQLTAGEERRAFARHVKVMRRGEPTEIDPELVGLGLMTQYLLDWSLADDRGQVVVIRDQPSSVVEAALNALDPASFREISDAIGAHVERQRVALDAEKKTRSTGSKLSVISGSAGS
jgi:hypothetical protein